MLPTWRTCPRLSAGMTVASAATASAGFNPRSRPTATAARAFTILCSPTSGRRACCRTAPMTTSNSDPSCARDRIFSARTSAEAAVPYIFTLPLKSRPNCETYSSSAFSTAVPPAGNDSISSYLARAMPASESKNSRCTGATFVTTPISGCAIFASARISPACDIPISITATSCSGSSFNNISGRPK